MRIDEVFADKELTLAAKAVYVLILKHPGGAEFHQIKAECSDKPPEILRALRLLVPKYVSSNGIAYRAVAGE